MLTPTLPPLVLIAGPTASGKSALALALAERSGGVIINADSAQVYRDLRIVSARPSPADEARLPHRLYGYRDGGQAWSAAEWAADAKAAIEQAHEDGGLPILVGGTGLYIRTLLDGIAPVPEIDAVVRSAVRTMTTASAYAALCTEDTGAAARLQPSDSSRIARALEVVRSTGRPLAEWQRTRVGGIGDAVALRPLVLLPPREWLYTRCDARFDMMMTQEGQREVAAIVARRLSPALPVMRAIGVREIAAYLDERSDAAAALVAGRTATRQYAKRQYTWFRNQPPAEWPRLAQPLDCDGTAAALAFWHDEGLSRRGY